MNLIAFNKKLHYQSLAPLWDSWGWPAPPERSLPDTGVIAEVDGKFVAATFLYVDPTSDFAFLGWTITDKQAPRLDRAKACSAVVEQMLKVAKESGRGLVLGYTQNPSLVNCYKRLGMEEMEHNVTTLAATFDAHDLEMLKDA